MQPSCNFVANTEIPIVRFSSRLLAVAALAAFAMAPAWARQTVFVSVMPQKQLVEAVGGGRLAYDKATFRGTSGQAIEIGIRPEDIELAAAGGPSLQLKREFVEEI